MPLPPHFITYRKTQLLSLILLLALLLPGCASASGSAAVPASTPAAAGDVLAPTHAGAVPAQEDNDDLRGVWIQARAINNSKKIDRMLDAAQAAGFNTIFVGTFFKGETLFDSRLAPKYGKVKPDFDPLAYLMAGARQRDLQVHAWFAVGDLEESGESILLEEHPDWALIGPEGNSTAWLNLNHPEVRRFVLDLIVEVVEKYGVDGIHLDYMRYPGSEWGFDRYSAELFEASSGIDLDALRYAGLPAYGMVKSNPLVDPGAAAVLASFSNGIPAVTLNHYGEGDVILLNWAASRRTFAAGGTILQRSLERLLQDGGEVALLRAEDNLQAYGFDGLRQAQEWLAFLGYEPVETPEDAIGDLSPDSVLVVPNVYLISQETAQAMLDFVGAGGGIIFIDGPTRSIQLPELQELTGMQGRGKHFLAPVLLTAGELHPLLPPAEHEQSFKFYAQRDEQWKAFRREMLSNLIGEMDAAIHDLAPDVAFTITVTADQEDARQEDLQDWQAWLDNGWVDRLIPRAYVEELSGLKPVLQDWQPVIRAYPSQVTLAVTVLNGKGDERGPKPADQLLAELQVVGSSGSSGLMVFNLNQMSDAQVEALGRYFPSISHR